MPRIVDLTCPFDADYSVPQYPTIAGDIQFGYKYTIPRDGRYCGEFHLFAHAGTHVDAPRHIFADGATLDQIPLDRFYGQAVCLDLPQGELGEITADLLEGAEPVVRPGDIVLIHTGWGRYFLEEPKDAYYLAHRQPGLVADAAEWLVEHGAKAVGIDAYAIRHPKLMPTLDLEARKAGAQRPVEPVHDILLRNNMVIVEQLMNLDQIAGKRVDVSLFPLPFVGFDGSPVRAVAFLP
jgi:kynurenine formamidase